MPATNLAGYTKRTTGIAIVFMTYCVGNIIGPHAFIAAEPPRYPTGCKGILARSVTQVAIALGLRFLLVERDEKRDAAAAMAAGSSDDHAAEETIGDLTDFEVCCTVIPFRGYPFVVGLGEISLTMGLESKLQTCLLGRSHIELF